MPTRFIMNNVNCPGCGRFFEDSGCDNPDCTGPSAISISNPSPKQVRQMMKQCNNELRGVKTSRKETVKGVTYHGAKNMLERGFTSTNVKNVLEKADATWTGHKENPNSTTYSKDGVWVNFGNSGYVTHITRRTKRTGGS